jgi:hypothetical protein
VSNGTATRRLIRIALLLSAPIAGFGSHAIARAANHIPAAAKSTLECTYGVVKSDPSVQSVDAYAIDDFRFAIEYTFQDGGYRAAADIVLTGPLADGHISYEGTLPDEQSENNLRSKCHIESAFDNLRPRPKPRQEWRWIALHH